MTRSIEVVLLILLGSPALVLHIAHVVLSLRLVQVALDEVLLVLKLEDQRKDDEELLEDVLMGLARFSTVSIAVSPCDVARKTTHGVHALSKVDNRVPVLPHGLRSVVGMPLLELRSKLRKVERLMESENPSVPSLVCVAWRKEDAPRCC